MELSVVARRGAISLKSRFLRTVAGEKGTLVIEAPTRGAHAVALYPGDKIDVVVIVEGERYGFRTSVRSRARARLSGRVEVSAVTIDYPAVLNQLQRRRYYRVKIPALDPIPVGCTGRTVDASGKKDGGELVRFTVPAIDMSAGGICLRLSKEHSHFARPGMRLAMLFAIKSAPKMRLLGVVRHVRQTPDGKDWLVGLEFLDPAKTLAGRRAVDRIMRYVTRRQREELKKKSGLE